MRGRHFPKWKHQKRADIEIRLAEELTRAWTQLQFKAIEVNANMKTIPGIIMNCKDENIIAENLGILNKLLVEYKHALFNFHRVTLLVDIFCKPTAYKELETLIIEYGEWMKDLEIAKYKLSADPQSQKDMSTNPELNDGFLEIGKLGLKINEDYYFIKKWIQDNFIVSNFAKAKPTENETTIGKILSAAITLAIVTVAIVAIASVVAYALCGVK